MQLSIEEKKRRNLVAAKKYYENNREKNNRKKRVVYSDGQKKCSKCKLIKTTQDFYKNKNDKSGLAHKCKSCSLSFQKLYRKTHKNKIANSVFRYREKNKEKIRLMNEKYIKKRKLSDKVYHLKLLLRSSVNKALKRGGYKKETRTSELLGVPYEIVKAYIESQFKQGMTWTNYGKWEIDHKIPLAYAKTKEELIPLFHYTNLQPLWNIENRIKGKKIIAVQTKLPI